jgi:hypothetical protein
MASPPSNSNPVPLSLYCMLVKKMASSGVQVHRVLVLCVAWRPNGIASNAETGAATIDCLPMVASSTSETSITEIS